MDESGSVKSEGGGGWGVALRFWSGVCTYLLLAESIKNKLH